MISRSLCLLLAVVGVITDQNETYCTLCNDHTMCIFEGVGSQCAPKVAGGLSPKDKAVILKLHNDYRQRVAQGEETLGAPGPQPPAANMRVLSWDDELESVAQRHADQCSRQHDTCRRVSRFEVGQNIAWQWGLEEADWTGAIQLWYDEVGNYSAEAVDAFSFSEDTAHYTQLVWADTYLIGCGYTGYFSGNGSVPEHLFVCNYGPAGNFLDAAVYRAGPTATKCSAKIGGGRNKGYPGLCS